VGKCTFESEEESSGEGKGFSASQKNWGNSVLPGMGGEAVLTVGCLLGEKGTAGRAEFPYVRCD